MALLSDDTDEMDNQHRDALRSTSPSVRASSRPGVRLEDHTAALSPMNLSSFSRHQPDSPTIAYPIQSRSSQFGGLYSSRLQAELGPLHNAPAHYGGDVDAHAVEQMASTSWPAPYAEETYPVGTDASGVYHSQLQVSQLQSAHAERDEGWTPQGHGAVRIGRGYDNHHIARIDVGAHPELSPWSQGTHAMADQQLASAPAMTTSISDHLPSGRSRDHMRTRSFPPNWPWGQESSSLYHLPSVATAVYSPHSVHHSPN